MASPKKSKKSKKDRKLKKNLSLVPVEPKTADSDWWDSFFNPSSIMKSLQFLMAAIRKLDLSKGSVQGREASSIVKLVPYQVLKFEGCKS
ncbi:unnamed protein product [Prunus armeniaca]